MMAVAMMAGLINKRDGPPRSSTSKTALLKYPLFTHQLHPPGFRFFSELQTGVQQYPSSTTHTHTQRPTQLFSMICQLKTETETHRLEKPKTRTPRQNHPQTQSLSPLFPSLLTPSPSLSTTTSSSKPTTVQIAAPKTKFQNSDLGPQKPTHTHTHNNNKNTHQSSFPRQSFSHHKPPEQKPKQRQQVVGSAQTVVSEPSPTLSSTTPPGSFPKPPRLAPPHLHDDWTREQHSHSGASRSPQVGIVLSRERAHSLSLRLSLSLACVLLLLGLTAKPPQRLQRKPSVPRRTGDSRLWAARQPARARNQHQSLPRCVARAFFFG